MAILCAADRWLYETYKLFTGDDATWAAYTEYPTEFAPTAQIPVNEMIELWLLSSRHVIEDECTMLAELDNGQGPGVYRKDDFPAIPVHPI